MDTRKTAFQVLYRILESGEYSHVVLNEALEGLSGEEKRERAFVTRLCEGTLERRMTLDYLLNCFSKTKTERMKPVIRTVLRMSVYQLFYMDSVPDSAVCNEAVKLVKKKGLSGLSGYVNGVLRTIARNREAIEGGKLFPDGRKEPMKALSIRYCLPEWLCDYFIREYGLERAGRIAAGLQRNPDITVRCNVSRCGKNGTIDQDEIESASSVQRAVEYLKEKLTAAGCMVRPGTYVPVALKLSGYDKVAALPGFAEGEFMVQDESSMLVVLAAGLKKGDTVLDVCAAPGGKALHAADLLQSFGKGTVLARDVSRAKVALLQENITRMGFENIKAEIQDARLPEERQDGEPFLADVVIADLPCSGIGILAKKPEIRDRMTPEKQKELAGLQREILTAASRYVRPGGVLLYSTCTINRAENEENAEFIRNGLGFEQETLRPYLPEALQSEVSGEGSLQLLPGIHDCDGFFIARFRKPAAS